MQKIDKSVTQAIAVHKQFPSGRHLQPVRFVYWAGGSARTVTTPDGMLKAISLFGRQLLKHSNPSPPRSRWQ
jgi:hypothetical protein